MSFDRAGDATFIVMSDHGFAPFAQAVNLNTWLADEGFLSLVEGRTSSKSEMFADVDWSKTKGLCDGVKCGLH